MQFLEFVANRLLANHPVDLSRVKVVFPNIRGGLFLKNTLAQKAGKPIWAPQTQPMETFMVQASGLRLLPEQSLVWRLYLAFKSCFDELESFEEFYSWGKLLLSDFDELDRELIPIDTFFKTVQNQKEIDETFGLEWSDDQRQAFIQFWKAAETLKDEGRERYFEVWQHLPFIYKTFTKGLLEVNSCYAGLAYRQLTVKGFPFDSLLDLEKIYFCGFVYLSKSEKQLLGALSREDKCQFLWEYPRVIKEKMPRELGWLFNEIAEHSDLSKTIAGNIYETGVEADGPKEIYIYEASGYGAQAKIAGRLTGNFAFNGVKDARVGLITQSPDLALYTLNALPDEVEKVNLTMGYPFKYSLLASFLQLWKKVHDPKRRKLVNSGLSLLKSEFLVDFMNHPYTKAWFYHERKGHIPSPKNQSSWSTFSELYDLDEVPAILAPIPEGQFAETIAKLLETLSGYVKPSADKRTFEDDFFYLAIRQLRELKALVEMEQIPELSDEWWWNSWLNSLQWANLAFTGEPIEGIQMMGLLESRNLDFKNLVFVGINDGELPNIYNGLSFFPFNIRQAFGLETHKKHDSVLAWQFYRLVQAAEEVHFVYNGVNSNFKKAEKSRYLWQIELGNLFKANINTVQIKEDAGPISADPIKVEKTAEIVESLIEAYRWTQNSDNDKIMGLSASALNAWLDCRLRFYFRYVAKLQKPEEWSLDKNTNLVGNVVHHVMEELYKGFMLSGKDILKSDIEALLPVVKENVEKQLLEVGHLKRISGGDILLADLIEKMIQNILKADAQRAPFKIIDLENDERFFPIEVRLGDEIVKIRALAKMDRVDKTQTGSIRIIDYKTGKLNIDKLPIADHFDRVDKKGSKEAIQLLFYGEAAMVNYPKQGETIELEFYQPFSKKPEVSLHFKVSENKELASNDYAALREDFMHSLTNAVETLLSPDSHFEQTENRLKCTYCDFIKICRRDLPKGF